MIENLVINSWGRAPSGDFTADFGNFDQCLNMLPMTQHGATTVRSQYCVLVGSNGLMSVGICIPDSCAPTLISAIINEYLNVNMPSVHISAANCRLQDDNTQVLPLDKCMM